MPYAVAGDGTRIFYEVQGKGAPLLLVSGQGTDRRMWDTGLADFARHHQVVTFDYRGTGDSGKPDTPYSTRGFAADAIAVLDAAGLQRAHAYGISMGGRVCQWLAIDYPARMGALVLGATTPGNAHGVAREPEIAAIMRDPAKLHAALELLYSPAWIESHPGIVLERTTSPEGLRLHYLASEGHDAWAELPSIKSPVLVLHGSEDRINATANAPLLAARIPGAELHIIEGGRHGYFVEFQAESARIVLDFFARHQLK